MNFELESTNKNINNINKNNELKIEIAKYSGYCFGVKRAIDITEKILQKNNASLDNKKITQKTCKSSNSKVFSIGQIIHNAGVTEYLKKMGLVIVNSVEEVEPDSIFIIRSHGIPQSIIKTLKEKNVKIIDTTCPFVKNAQKKAYMLSKSNCHVVIIGDKKHPEVKGIADRVLSEEKLSIVLNPSDLKDIEKKQKIGVVIQTTQVINNVEKIIIEILKKAKKIIIENTICNTTEKRQDEVKKLAKSSDLVIIVGGKNSANTTHLADISKKYNNFTYHVQNYSEIELDWIKNKKNIALCGGASTPMQDIINVKNFILKNIKD